VAFGVVVLIWLCRLERNVNAEKNVPIKMSLVLDFMIYFFLEKTGIQSVHHHSKEGENRTVQEQYPFGFLCEKLEIFGYFRNLNYALLP
jgi:hypothetical protein